MSVEIVGEKSVLTAPKTEDELHAWIVEHLGVRVARRPLVAGHSAPFEYIAWAYSEGAWGEWNGRPCWQYERAPADCIVWANRGGGKTFLGAVATMLDLLFKPGVQVRILGGSLEQSQRMNRYLRELAERDSVRDWVDFGRGGTTVKRLVMQNGAAAEVLAASETAIRGVRVQKLRCDEVELFDEEVWKAAQLTTRDMPAAADAPGPWGSTIRGSVEALSTMHVVGGLMSKLVEEGIEGSWDQGIESEGGDEGRLSKPGDLALPQLTHQRGDARPLPRGGRVRRVFRWGVADCLENCPPVRKCQTCALWDECGGRAKEAGRAGGHMTVAEVSNMKHRVDVETWKSEMLCVRPRRTDAVYPEFNVTVHTLGEFAVRWSSRLEPVRLVAGMDFGVRAETVVLLGELDSADVLRIVEEHAVKGLDLMKHVDVLKGWLEARRARGEPARLEWVGIDPAGRSREVQSGESCAKFMRWAGLNVQSVSREIVKGIRLVRARLAPADGSPPRLLVDARCTRLIECLKNYRYDPKKPEDENPKKDGNDHACDALRYLIVNLDAPGGVRVAGY